MEKGRRFVSASPVGRMANLGATLNRIVRVSFPSVLLGVVNELLLLAIVALVPGSTSFPIGADLGSRLSWSVLVCGGLAFGIAVGRGRVAPAGIAGLLIAPIAFDIATSVRKGTVAFLQLLQSTSAPSPIVVGGIKGIEYACLGMALIWLTRQRRWGVWGHLVAGSLAGLVFGGALLMLNLQSGAVGAAAFLTWVVNEFLFPIGCAFVIYVSDIGGGNKGRAH
jgi:hypothetical protein